MVKNISIKGYPETIKGFFYRKGKNWSLYICNFADYQFDGKTLIQNKFITDVEEGKDKRDLVINKIFELKKKKENKLFNTIELDDNIDLFNYLKNDGILIELRIKNQDVIYIGKVVEVKEKSIYLHLLSINLEWLEKENFKYNEIRLISLATDYLNSIALYLDSKN